MKLLSEYDTKKVIKPWGSEYVVFRDKSNISITLLNINKNKNTSFHCHPNKKTGFILLSGSAIIKLGLEKNDEIKFRANSKLMIRPGLFHSIKSISKNLTLLEFETPVDKNDLVRLYDNYGRKNTPYENKKKYLVNLTNNDIKFKKPKSSQANNYIISKSKLSIEYHSNFKNIIKRSSNEIYAVLNGSVVDGFNNKVLSVGDIVKNETLKKLSKAFLIKKKILFLRLKI